MAESAGSRAQFFVGTGIAVAGLLIALVAWLAPRSPEAALPPPPTSAPTEGSVVSGSHSTPSAPPTAGSSTAATTTKTKLKPGRYEVNRTSRYTLGGSYYATVSTVEVHDELITVAFDARGGIDLRPPQSSCVSDGQAQQRVAFGQRLTTKALDHYAGTLDFPAAGLVGPVTFSYSCSSDYEPVTLIG